MTRVHHAFGPFYCKDSKILILGSFPSVKSREVSFYYGHPQNRFWKVLSHVFSDDLPKTLEEKKLFLKRHQIALWDVIESCEITGSSDASIKNVEWTNLDFLLTECRFEKVLLNGKTADRLFRRAHQLSIPCIGMPSTSPANAAWSLNDLIEAYQKELILDEKQMQKNDVF